MDGYKTENGVSVDRWGFGSGYRFHRPRFDPDYDSSKLLGVIKFLGGASRFNNVNPVKSVPDVDRRGVRVTKLTK